MEVYDDAFSCHLLSVASPRNLSGHNSILNHGGAQWFGLFNGHGFPVLGVNVPYALRICYTLPAQIEAGPEAKSR
jgi:hypothetical protein